MNSACDGDLGARGALLAGLGRERVGDVGEHVEEVALLGVDDLLHLGELLAAEALLGEPLQQLLARLRLAPQGAQLGLVGEEVRQLAEQQLA